MAKPPSTRLARSWVERGTECESLHQVLDENANFGRQPAAGRPYGKDWHYPHLFNVAGSKGSCGDNTLRGLPGAKTPRLYGTPLDKDDRTKAVGIVRRLRCAMSREVLRGGDENDHRLRESSRNQSAGSGMVDRKRRLGRHRFRPSRARRPRRRALRQGKQTFLSRIRGAGKGDPFMRLFCEPSSLLLASRIELRNTSDSRSCRCQSLKQTFSLRSTLVTAR
jgi:hypothetical protein